MPLHTIEPVFAEDSEILILGSFPSVKSREVGFFYGHPQNRFWRVMTAVLSESAVPISIEEKKLMLLRNRIALWDVIASCTIKGSSDASITDVVPNDVGRLLNTSRVASVFCNGNTAYALYQRYLRETVGSEAVKLPSTSPANASWSLDRLIEAWSVILKNHD